MARTSTAPRWQQALVVLSGTVVAAVVITCLYWAQAIFIPLALAVFLTFVLSPVVHGFQRLRLGRLPAVLLVVLLAGLALGAAGWLVTNQVSRLLAELPKYSENIRTKVRALRELSEGRGALGELIHEITTEMEARPTLQPPPDQPTAVVVQPESPTWMTRLPGLLGHLGESLGAGALAIVLVVFMLLKQEDLRDRLLRLVGSGRITVTTKAVDEAGQRLSRFLLMQAVINAGFGLILAVGLAVIGVKYALLWGLLATLLRYVPYLGSWVALAPPLLLSLAMFQGWQQPLLVFGLIVVLEITTANVIEPRLFGQSIGVSEVALLVSAAFWAFLWGPIGMVLSNPMTVCLVVLGKYVPQLEFLVVLLGDEPPLSPEVSFYQRLLARDQDEATEVVQARVQEGARDQVYDTLLIPALTYARRDRERDDLTEADERAVLHIARELVEDLEDISGEEAAEESGAARPLLLGYPARDQADVLGLEMLRQLLDPAKWAVEVVAPELLTAELLDLTQEKKPALICIGSLPPGGLAHTRYLCKRLRSRFPDAKIVVGRWGLKGNVEQNREQLSDAGADHVSTTLLETQAQLNAWLPVLSSGPDRPRAPVGQAPLAKV